MGLPLVAGCHGSLRAAQRDDIGRWEAEATKLGHPEIRYEQAFDESTAYGLGFAPFGLAGFYVHRPGLAISGFTWPISLFWVPYKAHSTAVFENYMEMRGRILALRQATQPPAVSAPTERHRVPMDPRVAAKQLQRLERSWEQGRISEGEYQQERQRLEDAVTEEHWEQETPHRAPVDR